MRNDLLDHGFSHPHSLGADAQNTFPVKPGRSCGPRLGIKGTEEAGRSLSADFILENGFAVDAGAFSAEENISSGAEPTFVLRAAPVGSPSAARRPSPPTRRSPSPDA